MRVAPAPIAPTVRPPETGSAPGAAAASRTTAPERGFESAIEAAERTGSAQGRRAEAREQVREKPATDREKPGTERANAAEAQASQAPPAASASSAAAPQRTDPRQRSAAESSAAEPSAAASSAPPEQAAPQGAPSPRPRGHAALLARRGVPPGEGVAPGSGAARGDGAAEGTPGATPPERAARTTAPALLAAIRGERWRGAEPGAIGADAQSAHTARAEGSSADETIGDAATASATLRARMAGTLFDGTRSANGSAAALGPTAAARPESAPGAGPAPDAARRAERDAASQPAPAAPGSDTRVAGDARAPARATESPGAGDDAGGAQGNARRFGARAEEAAVAGGAATRGGPTGASGSAAAAPAAARGASAAIVEQVATRLAQAAPGGAVTIQLEPADHGRVQVTFRWSGRELTVRVAAEQGEVAALLAADLGRLETSLSRLADPVKVEVPVDGFADPRSGAGSGQHGSAAGERAPDGSPAARRDGAEPHPTRRGLPSGPDPARRGQPADAARLDVLT